MRPGWIRTYTGTYISVTCPEPEKIDVRDIAHQLSLECRWGGATTRHYSVAEHSIWVSKFVRELVPAEHREVATVHALLHDAHEAYLKDIPTPLKVLLEPAYSRLSDGLDAAIRVRFGLEAPSDGVRDAIHQADGYAAWCEAQALLAECKMAKSGSRPPEGLLARVPMATEVRRVLQCHEAEAQFLSHVRYAIAQLEHRIG
jgi:hypothetical protein